ncbi:MAG: GNAT family N-acetyltransferase [Candidatus Aegiribacteria sp.]|nr:GNAT family N-acetyltransferase [Candidatus Aegiribacteria sp.]
MTCSSSKSQMQTESIERFLKKDTIRNLNMLYFMETNPVHTLERTGDSVLMRGTSDHRWVYISSPDEQELRALSARLTGEDRYFAVIEDWMLPVITSNRKIEWQLSCMKLVLPEEVAFSEIPLTGITPLSVDDVQYLHENSIYQSFSSPDYIRERIQRGPGAGIRESGQLVAWILTHDDSAIGFLHVLEAHRKKGYAYNLTVHMIQQLRQRGRIPFVQIEESNIKSISLAQKLGFKETYKVNWLSLK